uniref:CRAL-TRIO domain-containing protein n=1 Tax=viral metagenome TaxID=1070528 RepID=A0A6C0JG59_9ZZZZ
MNYNIINNNLTTKNLNINANINLKLNEEKLQELLNNFCHIKINNEIEIHYKFFKIINTFIDQNYILNYLIFIVENILKNYETFIVHVNIEKLTLLEIEKNRLFVQEMSNVLKEKFPDKLEVCNIYEGSFIFKQIYNLLAIFIDKKTLKKIRFQE